MFFSFWILGGRWVEVRGVRKPGDVGFLFFSFFFFGVRPVGGNSWEFREYAGFQQGPSSGLGGTWIYWQRDIWLDFWDGEEGGFTWSTASLVVFCLGRIVFLGGLCASVLGNLI